MGIAERTKNERWYDSALAFIAQMQTKIGGIDGALNTVVRIDNTFRRHNVLVNIATDQSRAGDTAGALRTANRIVDAFDRRRGLAAIVAERTKAMDIAGAVFVAEQIKDPFHRGETMGNIASAQADAGDIIGALQTVEQIDYEFWRYRSLAAVAVVQGRLGDEAGANTTFSAAQRVAKQLDGARERASAIAYIAVSRAILAAEVEDGAKARSIIEAAIGTVERAGDGFLFEKEIAAAQGKAGDIEGALESWRSSVSRYGVLEAIANAMIEAGELAGALELADRINGVAQRDDLRNRKTSEPITESRSKSSGSDLNISSGKSRIVLVPVPGQKETNWRTAALAAIAEAQVKADDFSGALETVERIIGDPEERARLLAIIIVMQAGSGDLSGAAGVVEQVDDAQLRSLAAWGAIMNMSALEGDDIMGALSSVAGDPIGALEVVEYIDDTLMRISALAHIAVAVAGGHQWTSREH